MTMTITIYIARQILPILLGSSKEPNWSRFLGRTELISVYRKYSSALQRTDTWVQFNLIYLFTRHQTSYFEKEVALLYWRIFLMTRYKNVGTIDWKVKNTNKSRFWEFWLRKCSKMHDRLYVLDITDSKYGVRQRRHLRGAGDRHPPPPPRKKRKKKRKEKKEKKEKKERRDLWSTSNYYIGYKVLFFPIFQ